MPEMIYLIDIKPDTDGSLLATCKAFPELTTFGSDKAQVWKSARRPRGGDRRADR
jgi:hypothetical protein